MIPSPAGVQQSAKLVSLVLSSAGRIEMGSVGNVAGRASPQMREVVVWKFSVDQEGVKPSELH